MGVAPGEKKCNDIFSCLDKGNECDRQWTKWLSVVILILCHSLLSAAVSASVFEQLR